MPLTGNIPRTFGHILLALGIIAVVLGIVGFLLGGIVVDSATDNPEFREDAGDMIEALVLGGMVLVSSGTAAIIVGLILMGIARGLRERLARRMAGAPGAGTPTNAKAAEPTA